jgi:hypothetical protein
VTLRRSIALALLAALLLALEPAGAATGEANIFPSAIAYMGNAGGREVPVYWKPRLRDLPIGFFDDGERVEVISSVVRTDGNRFVKIRGRVGFEAWALTRTLQPNPPFQENGRGAPRYAGTARLTTPMELCVNPAAMPSGSFSQGLVVDMVNRSIDIWQSAVAGRIPLTNTGICKVSVKEHKDGRSVVGFGSPKDEKGKALLGMTHKRVVGNRIVEADIELSNSMLSKRVLNPAWLAERSPISCLSQTLLHEIGHVIGMGHAPENITSVMVPGAVCVRITQLPRADVENAQHLYS